MKSFCLFLAITFGVISTASSQSEELVSFVKYGDCYVGLKTRQGKIIWPAEFESIVKLYDFEYNIYPRRHYWIAEKNGSYGVIDPEGKLLLPFSFSRISVYENGLITADENAVYFYSKFGELTLKLDGYSWIKPTETGYLIQKNEKYGFLGLRLNEVLAPIYDLVQFMEVVEWQEGRKQVTSNRFLDVEQNEKKGIFDLERNKWLIPFTEESIYAQWAIDCSQSDAIFRLYNFETKQSRVVNSSGTEMLSNPNDNRHYFQLTPTDSCGTQSIQLAYIESNNKMKVLNLKTGKYSNEHNEIFPCDGISIYFDDKKWGVMDPAFNEFKELRYPKYSLEDFYNSPNNPLIPKARARFSALFLGEYRERIDSVLITLENAIYTKGDQWIPEKYGLINFHSGKRIEAQYDQIVRAKTGNQTIFWGFKSDDPNVSYSNRKIDIYNSDMKRITELDDIGRVYFDFENYRDLTVTIEKNDLHGVVDLFGKTIIPIEFNECWPRQIFHSENPNDYTPIFICTKKGGPDDTFYQKLTYLTTKGTEYIPSYKHLYTDSYLIFATKNNDNYDIYSSKGELLLEDVKRIIYEREVDSNANCIGTDNSSNKKHIYLVKGDRLYHYFDRKLELYDSKSFDFTENYCFFMKEIIIDKNAKVIASKAYGVSAHSQSCSPKIDEYPVPKKEPIIQTRPTPIAQIEKAPAHQWKLGPTKSQTEWFLYNPDGTLKYDTAFDFPAFAGGVFKQNGKLGRFDLDFNIDLKPDYDYIHYTGLLVKKDHLWFLRKGKTDEWSEGFDAISTKKWNNLRFVFQYGHIGLLDDSLNFKVPLTDSVTFVEKYDLVQILNIRGYHDETKRHKVQEIIFNATPTLLYRKINNAHLIEEAFLNSTANEVLELYPVNKSQPDLSDEFSYFSMKANENQIYKERIPTFFNQYYFSETTYTRTQKYNGTYLEGRHYADKATFNYKIVNYELVPIELKDIIKSDSKSTEKLNEMILRELTKIQAYGNNCMDIDSKIEALKDNFTIYESMIVFHSGVRGGFEISLYFKELNDLILHPNKLALR